MSARRRAVFLDRDGVLVATAFLPEATVAVAALILDREKAVG